MKWEIGKRGQIYLLLLTSLLRKPLIAKRRLWGNLSICFRFAGCPILYDAFIKDLTAEQEAASAALEWHSLERLRVPARRVLVRADYRFRFCCGTVVAWIIAAARARINDGGRRHASVAGGHSGRA